jgi:hypothetical protein
MININELKDGKCKVIIKLGGEIKTYSGTYSNEYKCVFFAIPSERQIIGYEQGDLK